MRGQHRGTPPSALVAVPSALTCGVCSIWAAAAIRSRRRDQSRKVLRRSSEGDSDMSGLPSDEELRLEFDAMLPHEERLRRRVLRAEETLRKADERIAELGIDVSAAAQAQEERAQVFSPIVGSGPRITICGPKKWKGVHRELFSSLLTQLPEESTRWQDVEQLGSMSAEEVASRFSGQQVIAFCPGMDEGEMTVAAAGLSKLLRALPDVETASRVVLLAGCAGDDAAGGDEGAGGTDFFAVADAAIFGRRQTRVSPSKSLEDMLKVAARERGANDLDPPLYVTFVRATLTEDPKVGPPAVSARLPATVRDATTGLRSTLVGGVSGAARSFQDSGSGSGGGASASVAATALAFVLRRGVDVAELTVSGGAGGPDAELDEEGWDEMMLPLVGPELWRMPVESSSRARAWVRGWVDFNYNRGANQAGAAMRRAGLRTPVEVRETSLGCCVKFSPAGTRTPGAGFEGLSEGGLEILVDDARDGRPARLRVRRCSYGWRKKPRETSERTIISKLRRDWETAQKFRT